MKKERSRTPLRYITDKLKEQIHIIYNTSDIDEVIKSGKEMQVLLELLDNYSRSVKAFNEVEE